MVLADQVGREGYRQLLWEPTVIKRLRKACPGEATQFEISLANLLPCAC